MAFPWQTWECCRQCQEDLGLPATALGLPMTCLGAQETSLEAPGTSPGAPATSLDVRRTILGGPTTSQGAPATGLAVASTSPEAPGTSLRAHLITVKKSGHNIIISGNTTGAPRNRHYYLLFYNFYTDIFNLYTHHCIYISMCLCCYPSTDGISELAAASAWEQFDVPLKMMMEGPQRCTLRPWSGQFAQSLGAHDCTNLEARIELVWRWEFGDALGRLSLCQLGVFNWVNLEIHMAAIMEWD